MGILTWKSCSSQLLPFPNRADFGGKKNQCLCSKSGDEPQESVLQGALMLYVTHLPAYTFLRGAVPFHSFLWCFLFKKKSNEHSPLPPHPHNSSWCCLLAGFPRHVILAGEFHRGRNGVARCGCVNTVLQRLLHAARPPWASHCTGRARVHIDRLGLRLGTG